MRVGIDARYGFRTARRGTGEYIAALLRNLPSVADVKDEFVLYADRRAEIDGLSLADPRFRVRRLATAHPLLWEEVALPSAAARDDLDLLHLTSNYGPSWAPCPTVYTIHDLIEFIRPALGPMRLPFRHMAGRAVRIRTLPRQARRARRVITVSHMSSTDLVRILGLRADRVRVIPLGISPDFKPAKDPSAVRERLRGAGYPVPDHFVLALGALDPRKNGPFLMRSFARLHERIPSARLWMVGVERPQEHPIPFDSWPEWLTVRGFVPRETLIALLQVATAFVYPSLYEGFGLPVIEAMACGAPVLASDRGSLPEVTGGAGILFDPASEEDLSEALVRLLTDESLQSTYIQAGRARAGAFSQAETARRTYGVYREALEDGA